ncbi:MAG: hypothetical protein WD844_14090 [Thermoleophilaceae bacterium]
MGQTKKKRKRKHRGTPAGTIEARGRTGRPPTKAEGKQRKTQTAADRRAERLAKPPTWRGALNRSAIAALLFGLVVILAFGQDPASGAALAAVMILIYMPMTYYMDLFLHKRFQKRAEVKR